MFDTHTLLEEFKNLDSIPNEAKIKLTKLQENMKYAAPELLPARFFNGWRSADGLCEILQTHAPDNEDASALYSKVIEQYTTWSAGMQADMQAGGNSRNVANAVSEPVVEELDEEEAVLAAQ